MPGAKITALGTYTPPGMLTNQDLERLVETTNDWIIDRTGISTRRIAAPDMATSDMAVLAAQAALAQNGTDPASLDAILVCTVTPDMNFPATACLVQHRIGAAGAWGFDLMAACSGFLYGLTTAAHLVMSGSHKKVLVIGADTMSRIIDYKDRSTCILFGDGAGAMLVEQCENGEPGFLGFHNEVDGSGGSYLMMPAGGSRMPASVATIEQRLHYVKQDGQQVFKYAVRKMHEACQKVLEKTGVSANDVTLMIPHQANRRIIEATAARIGIPLDRVIINIGKFGNTTGATIPLATGEALAEGRLKKGDLVLFSAVGAGFTVGANLWRWSY
ncbi:MAG: ketoacyl-ACP synthase III [Acidobacteriia bacterium]|nr:ketoacyl-ACP synthase III [Terriglobia bacterium]